MEVWFSAENASSFKLKMDLKSGVSVLNSSCDTATRFVEFNISSSDNFVVRKKINEVSLEI